MVRQSTPGAVVVVREEFRAKQLTMQYDHYEYFVYSQCLPVWLLWIIRLLMGSFCVGVFLYMSITSPFITFTPNNSSESSNATTDVPVTFKRHFYLCYLTIWSYLMITLYFVCSIINMVSLKCQFSGEYTLASGGFKSTDNLLDWQQDIGQGMMQQRANSGCNSILLRLQWLLYGVSANAAIIVTIGYFGVIYRFVKEVNPGPVSAIDLFVHGFNTTFMFMEVITSGVPVRLLHGLYTAAYGLLYTLFSLFYWIPDHSNVIYPILLDWNHPGLTLLMIGGILLIGLPLIQLFWWMVYLIRCRVALAVASRTDWNPGQTV